ncbi:MAG TPA: hypothetical protein VNN12_09650 [Dehalococcoidia bacterium]|nr:hypothetical protein [Dehalococcoidia bacterium]
MRRSCAAIVVLAAAAPVVAEAAGSFGGQLTGIVARNPRAGGGLAAIREAQSRAEGMLRADPRLDRIRARLVRHVRHHARRYLESARQHGLKPGSGLLSSVRRGLRRAWHLTGLYAKRVLRLPKIPMIFGSIRWRLRDAFALVVKIQAGRLAYRPGMFRDLFPKFRFGAPRRVVRNR